MNQTNEDSAFGPGMMFGIPGPGPKKDTKGIPSDPKMEKGIEINNKKKKDKMKKLSSFSEFMNENSNSELNEGVASLDSYYKNAEKSVRESAKKIDAILNKEIKSDSTKKELLDLITDMVEEYAFEFADNRDQERY